MSRTIVVTNQHIPRSEFKDKLLDLINDNDIRNIIGSKDGDKFIEELSKQFRKMGMFEKLLSKLCERQNSFFIEPSEMDEETRVIDSKMRSIAKEAEDSLDDCELYARFLYLTDSLRNPILFRGWIFEWLRTVFKRYEKNESVILKFVYGFAYNYCELFEILFGKLNFKASFDKAGLPYPDRINIPDGAGFHVEVLRKDYKQIVSIQKMYIRLTEETLDIGTEAHRRLIEHFGRTVFRKVSKQSLLEVYLSFIHARLAGYFLSSSSRNEDIREGKKELNIALDHYEDNSYAIALQASLMVNEDPTGTSKGIEDKFDKAFSLAEDQYVGLQLQTEIKVKAKLGLAYVYNNRGKYDSSEKLCNEALELKPEAYLKAVILLNRGRSRLDDENLVGAEDDFKESLKQHLLESQARTNLGVVYRRQGRYDKAEQELNEAIEKCPTLPHAYHNLGVLYNEEGKKQQAERLFRTALNMDRNFKEARDALRKFQQRQGNSIPDWVDWWFGADASKIKKGIGLAIIILSGVFICKASHIALFVGDIPQSIIVVIGISIVLLLLPCISKLKFGPIELEMESKGENPTLK
jgi:tetratricopeptide (TPR) repeat protein